MTNITTNIAQVNIVLDSTRNTYHNGMFIPVFQDALMEVAKSSELQGMTFRVLLYILSCVDEKNSINLTMAEISKELDCSYASVNRAVTALENMNIICHKGNRHGGKFELTSKMVNPRLAYRGNTRYLKKDSLPILLCPDGKTPLIAGSMEIPELEF